MTEPGSADAIVHLSFPPDARFVGLARLSAVTLAAEADFDVDQIDEWKMGVNEVTGLLVEWGATRNVGAIELTFRVGIDAIEMTGVAGADGTEPLELDDLARHILDAVTDGYDVGPGRGRIVKRRAR